MCSNTALNSFNCSLRDASVLPKKALTALKFATASEYFPFHMYLWTIRRQLSLCLTLSWSKTMKSMFGCGSGISLPNSKVKCGCKTFQNFSTSPDVQIGSRKFWRWFRVSMKYSSLIQEFELCYFALCTDTIIEGCCHMTSLGQSYDFWRVYCLFVARVALFAPERSKGANDVSLLSIHKAKSLYKSEFWREKADLPFWNKISNSTELQSEQVQIQATFGIEMVSSGILRVSLAKRSCLTPLQPIRIRAANAFTALAFLVWPARRRVLQRAVWHTWQIIGRVTEQWSIMY